MNRKNPSESTGGPHYLDESCRALEARAEARRRVRRLRFDTIAVHGLYTVQEALDHNHGAIMEPTFFSSAQAYRHSAEIELALG